MEGKNIHLLGDATTNNNSNPPNSGTVMLVQASSPPTLEAALQRIAEECEEQVGNFPPKDPRIAKQCKELGTGKHACCAEKLDDANRHRAKEGEPQQAYSEPAYDRATGKMIPRQNPLPGPPPLVPRTQSAIRNQARGFYRSGQSPYRSISHAIGSMCAGKKFPDVVVPSDPSRPCERGNVERVYDFKFPCPRGKKPQVFDRLGLSPQCTTTSSLSPCCRSSARTIQRRAPARARRCRTPSPLHIPRSSARPSPKSPSRSTSRPSTVPMRARWRSRCGAAPS
jgi:hypothetical protein